MFNLFKNKKELKITDWIWKNDAAKYKGIISKINSSTKIILISYFNETKKQITLSLVSAQLPYSTDLNRKTNITVTEADRILNSISDLSDYEVCFIEHHPSFLIENKIMQHLQDNCNVKEVSFHLSFEEPLLHYFGGEKIVEMLERMGLKEDEALQHAMISKSIVNAQHKIDEKAPGAMETASAKNWFEVNLNDVNSQ